jgi:hypothetical protein
MDTLPIAKDAIAQIQRRFPSLRIVEEQGVPVELSFSIPVQAGVKHKVWLALQNNDELSFGVGSFQVEWFPCTDPARVKEFVEAVVGYLSGNYRIMEHRWGAKCVKAQLQAPEGATWKTLGTWSNLWALMPGRKTTSELRNV